MGKLIQRLQDPARSGIYRAQGSAEIVDAVRGSKIELARISYGTKEILLKNIARALAFPEWFGENWDALEDCLTDLSWRDAGGYVLVFENAQSNDDLGVLTDVLRSSAEFWAGRGTPFFAVFIDPARMLALPELFRAR